MPLLPPNPLRLTPLTPIEPEVPPDVVPPDYLPPSPELPVGVYNEPAPSGSVEDFTDQPYVPGSVMEQPFPLLSGRPSLNPLDILEPLKNRLGTRLGQVQKTSEDTALDLPFETPSGFVLPPIGERFSTPQEVSSALKKRAEIRRQTYPEGEDVSLGEHAARFGEDLLGLTPGYTWDDTLANLAVQQVNPPVQLLAAGAAKIAGKVLGPVIRAVRPAVEDVARLVGGHLEEAYDLFRHPPEYPKVLPAEVGSIEETTRPAIEGISQIYHQGEEVQRMLDSVDDALPNFIDKSIAAKWTEDANNWWHSQPNVEIKPGIVVNYFPSGSVEYGYFDQSGKLLANLSADGDTVYGLFANPDSGIGAARPVMRLILRAYEDGNRNFYPSLSQHSSSLIKHILGKADVTRSDALDKLANEMTRFVRNEDGSLNISLLSRLVPDERAEWSELDRLSRRFVGDNRLITEVYRLMSVPTQVLSQKWLARQWRAVNGIMSEAVRRQPALQMPLVRAGAFNDAQMSRTAVVGSWLVGELERAFGPDVVSGVAKSAAHYSGTETHSWVGSLWHILNDPKQYRLSIPQVQAVSDWYHVMDSDYQLTQSMGMNVAEMVNHWVPHMLKSASMIEKDEIARALSGQTAPSLMRKPNWAKTRTLSTEQFLAQVEKINKERIANNLPPREIETNVANIMWNRLSEANRLRTTKAFLDGVVEQAKAHNAWLPNAVDRPIVIAGQTWPWRDINTNILPGLGRDEVMKVLRPLSEAEDTKLIEKVVDGMTALRLNFDFGAIGRQGYLAATADPLGWASQQGTILKQVTATPYTFAVWMARNLDRIEFWNQHNLQTRMSPIELTGVGTPGRKPWVYNLPTVEWLNELQFQKMMPILKLKLADNLYEMLLTAKHLPESKNITLNIPILGALIRRGVANKTEDELADIAASIVNNRLGGINWREVSNKPHLLERFFFLTPGWLRGQLGFNLNALNLTNWSLESVLVRKFALQEWGMSFGVQALFGAACGSAQQQLDPRDNHFMEVRCGQTWTRISPSTPIWRAIGRSLVGRKETPNPFESSDPNRSLLESLSDRLSELTSAVNSRHGVVAAALVEGIRGEDYYGRQIPGFANALRSKENAARTAEWLGLLVSPIQLATMREALSRHSKMGLDVGSAVAGVGEQFFGANTRWDTLTDVRQSAIDKMPEEFFTPSQRAYMSRTGQKPRYGLGDGDPNQPDMLELHQKRIIDQDSSVRAADAELRQGTQGALDRTARQQDILDRQKLDDQLSSGKINRREWITELYNLDRGKAVDMLKQRLERQSAGEVELYNTPYEKAFTDYLKTFQEVNPTGATYLNDNERDILGEKLSAKLASMPDDVRDYVVRNLHSNATPQQREFYQATSQLRDFFRIRDDVIQSVPQLNQWFNVDLPDMRRNEPDKAQLLETRHPAVGALNRLVMIRRFEYLVNNPEKIPLVEKWYPHVSMRSYMAAREKTGR